MKFQNNPASFETLSRKQWEDWNHTMFTLFWKLWLIILCVQVFFFLFFKPTEDCGIYDYFLQYILLPSGLEAIALAGIRFVCTTLAPSRKRRAVSLYTILLSTFFAGVTVCVHTSVKFLPTLLLLPMILTPLYRDKLMTALQAVLVILLYILSYFYFIPNPPYILPENSVSPYVELSVFAGAALATCTILQRVNAAIVLNEERSRHDSLTHLYNHENFYLELECCRSQFEKNRLPFSVIIADIDDFKKINDTYGHASGDRVIQRVSELFIRNTQSGAFCARYGGEEFAMILPDADPVSAAEEIRSAFENFAFETPDGERHFTLSIGAAVYDRNYPNGSAFFEKADSALYLAKRKGKNRVILYDASAPGESS